MCNTLEVHTVKELLSDRLKLRPPTSSASDRKTFYELVTAPEVCKYDDMSPEISRYRVNKEYLGYVCKNPLTRAVKISAQQELSVLLIEARDTRKVLGAIYIFPMSEYGALEIGYQLHPGNFGKGYAQEALKSLIPELFFIGVFRIECRVDPDNQGSIKLLDRLGFFYEGNARGACLVRGVRRSEFVYSLLRTDDLSRINADH